MKPELFLLPGAAASPQARRWGAPRQRTKTSANMEKLLGKATPLNLQETVAESVYIARPLVHRILPSDRQLWQMCSPGADVSLQQPCGLQCSAWASVESSRGSRGWRRESWSSAGEDAAAPLRPSSPSSLLLRPGCSLCRQLCSSQRGEVPQRLRAGRDEEEDLPAAVLPAALAVLRQVLAVGFPGGVT